MLSADELTDLQADAATLLDLDADIQRNMSSTVVIGQKTEDWQSILSPGPTVKCGMRPPSATEAAQFASAIASKKSTVISFPDGQDVQEGDRVIVASTTWTVQAPLTPQSNSVYTQVLATKIG